MCVLAQPRSFRSCQGPFLHLRAQFLPRSHLRPTSGRARTPVTFSKSPVTCSGRDSALGTKCLLKQRAAPQRPSGSCTGRPRPWGGALLGSFPHPALNSSNRHLWSLPGAGFTQKPVTHSLISGSPEQVLCPGVRKPAPWRPSSWEACGRLWPGSRVLVVGLRSSSPSALYPGSFGGEPSRVGTPMVGLCWFPRLVGQNNLRRTLEGVGFSSIITNVCAILYFTNKILKSCGSNKGTFLWARP